MGELLEKLRITNGEAQENIALSKLRPIKILKKLYLQKWKFKV